ncbi:hypothetical protein PR048_031619 [Dryococelus australis]|uniref:Uncharacterized protein n=1 Tax=Dryococelus australis TaxID=614101 RepID=A0ABQ9G5S8_9NEOP|nr:hypothetical protein PR048_031619 [Dryococelus australis]
MPRGSEIPLPLLIHPLAFVFSASFSLSMASSLATWGGQRCRSWGGWKKDPARRLFSGCFHLTVGSGFVLHGSNVRKPGTDSAGNRTRYALVEGEYANTTAAPWKLNNGENHLIHFDLGSNVKELRQQNCTILDLRLIDLGTKVSVSILDPISDRVSNHGGATGHKGARDGSLAAGTLNAIRLPARLRLQRSRRDTLGEALRTEDDAGAIRNYENYEFLISASLSLSLSSGEAKQLYDIRGATISNRGGSGVCRGLALPPEPLLHPTHAERICPQQLSFHSKQPWLYVSNKVGHTDSWCVVAVKGGLAAPRMYNPLAHLWGISPTNSAAFYGVRSSLLVILLVFHLGEPGLIPGAVALGFPTNENLAVRVFSGISRFPRPFIPALLLSHLTSPTSTCQTSMLGATLELVNEIVLENDKRADKWKTSDVSGRKCFGGVRSS